jgi:hypothetical protein
VAIFLNTLPGSGRAGYVGIVMSKSGPTTLSLFQQNSPVGSVSHVSNISTTYLRGYLRPKL